MNDFLIFCIASEYLASLASLNNLVSLKTLNDYIDGLIVKNSDNINAFISECVKLLKPRTETLLKNFYRNNTKTVYIDIPPQNFT